MHPYIFVCVLLVFMYMTTNVTASELNNLSSAFECKYTQAYFRPSDKKDFSGVTKCQSLQKLNNLSYKQTSHSVSCKWSVRSKVVSR